jgi:hypothetical protein
MSRSYITVLLFNQLFFATPASQKYNWAVPTPLALTMNGGKRSHQDIQISATALAFAFLLGQRATVLQTSRRPAGQGRRGAEEHTTATAEDLVT